VCDSDDGIGSVGLELGWGGRDGGGRVVGECGVDDGGVGGVGTNM